MPDPVPQPDQIRQTASDVLKRPYYRLDEDTRLAELWEQIREWFRRLLDPLGSFLDSVYATSPALYYVIIGAMLLLVLGLMFHITWSVFQAIKRRQRTSSYVAQDDSRKHQPEYWEEQAQLAVAGEDYLLASRYLLHATLLRLEQRRKGTLKRAATHREYLRRFRATPVYDALREMVETVESRWFGGVPCTSADYQRCREAHAAVLYSLGTENV